MARGCAACRKPSGLRPPIATSSWSASAMLLMMTAAAVVIMAVLLFTSRSYFEVVIFLIVFSVAALLNMGTNFWLGEISSITNSIAVILQLALAIDYAIIFSHRYQDEIDRFPTEREALIEALSKSIVEISSSSLTTISGLVALMLMQFRLGYDLGLVLSKGILCSLITVFLLMPGLIASFFRPLRRTTHKSHVPDITGWGRFLMKTRFGFVAVFAGAANTPLACTFMGIELFGAAYAVPIAVACFVAYLCSGHNGIYLSQRVAIPKVPADGLAPDATLRETRTRRTALRAQNRVS